MFNQTTLHMRILNTTVNSAMKWLTLQPYVSTCNEHFVLNVFNHTIICFHMQ